MVLNSILHCIYLFDFGSSLISFFGLVLFALLFSDLHELFFSLFKYTWYLQHTINSKKTIQQKCISQGNVVHCTNPALQKYHGKEF